MPHSRSFSIPTLVIAILALLAGGYLVLHLLVAFLIPSETTAVRKYESIREKWAPTGLVDHFPDAIPSDATEVRLSFFPGFLQGGAHFQVRMILPTSDVAAISDSMMLLTPHQYQGGAFYDHYNEDRQNNLPTTAFHTADDPQTYAFPAHYTLYVLHADNRGGEWNHGETCGVVVSRQLNEVIYWVESW